MIQFWYVLFGHRNVWAPEIRATGETNIKIETNIYIFCKY